jgi:hypothetical protein
MFSRKVRACSDYCGEHGYLTAESLTVNRRGDERDERTERRALEHRVTGYRQGRYDVIVAYSPHDISESPERRAWFESQARVEYVIGGQRSQPL